MADVAAARLPVRPLREGPRGTGVGCKDTLQVLAGVAGGLVGDVFGGAFGDEFAAGVAALRSEVDDPVGGFDDVEVVFDDDDGVAGIGQALEDLDELAGVGKVEAGGGFVEDVDGLAGGALGEFGGELDALGFATGKGSGGLAEADVAEADIDEGAELAFDGRDVSGRRTWASSTVMWSTSAMVLPL